MKKAVDLTKGNILGKLIKFSLPMLAGSLLQVAYYVVDSIIVGNFIGKGALAAIDSVFMLNWMPLAVFIGYATGATVIIAQLNGAKKLKEAHDMIETSNTISIIVGVVLSILGILISKPLLHMINVPEEIFREAHIYISICYGALAFQVIYNMCSSILRAKGDSQTPFVGLAVASVANMVLDYLFVVTFNWGIAGAAIATLIGIGISAVIVFMAVIREYSPRFVIDKSQLALLFKKGTPVALQSSFFPISNIVVRSYINSVATTLQLSGWALIGTLDSFIWVYIDSIGAAMATYVGQNFGAGQYTRARRGIWAGVAVMVAPLAIFVGILYFYSGVMAKIFVSSADYNVLPVVESFVHIQGPFYIVYSIAELMACAIRGTGDTFMPMLLTLIFTCVTRLIWVWFLLPEGHTMYNIIWCYPVSWVLTALVFLIYYFIIRGKTFMKPDRPRADKPVIETKTA